MNIKIEITIDGENAIVNIPVEKTSETIKQVQKPTEETNGLPASFEDAVKEMMVGPIPKKTETKA